MREAAEKEGHKNKMLRDDVNDLSQFKLFIFSRYVFLYFK